MKIKEEAHLNYNSKEKDVKVEAVKKPKKYYRIILVLLRFIIFLSLLSFVIWMCILDGFYGIKLLQIGKVSISPNNLSVLLILVLTIPSILLSKLFPDKNKPLPERKPAKRRKNQ